MNYQQLTPELTQKIINEAVNSNFAYSDQLEQSLGSLEQGL